MDTDQLREQLDRIAAADPIDEHSARSSIEAKAAGLRRKRRLRASAVVAASIIIVGAVAFALVRSGDEQNAPSIHPAQSTPETTTSTAPQDQASLRCVFQRDPADSSALSQPATVALPDGTPNTILPGTPLTASESVTLDGDGAAPGESGTAAAQLWGAATTGGPFAGLESAAPGDILTLIQIAPEQCVQRWRITQVVTSESALSPNRPILRLVGFAPGGTPQFYVEAVPASNQSIQAVPARSAAATLAGRCASIPADATTGVFDHGLGVGVTVSSRSKCEQEAALSPDPAGDLGVVFTWVNGSAHAEYHNLTRVFKDGSEVATQDPAVVDPAEAQQRIAEQRARRPY